MPITTCFSCVLFLCRLIAYEAVNLVLAFIFILCTILICPSQAWEAGPCRETFSLSCNSPLPTPLLHKQSPIPPIKIHSKANQNQATFFESGPGGSLPRSRFLDVTQRWVWGALREVQKTAARETSRAVAHLKDIISTPLKFCDR